MNGYRFHRDDGLPFSGSIFVFESNFEGDHSQSADGLLATRCFGARNGKGEGLSGSSYALPTTIRGHALPLHNIMAHILFLHNSALFHAEKEFFIPATLGRTAGYSTSDIAPLFSGLAENLVFPSSWQRIIGERRSPAQIRKFAMMY